MATKAKKIKVGIVGCGAIGSRIAQSMFDELKNECHLTGIYDIIEEKSKDLARQLKHPNMVKRSLKNLIASCDLMVEAVNAKSTHNIILQAIKAKRHVLAMSVGKLLNEQNLFRLANRYNCHILLPSGAIAGIDAIKAASLVAIEQITLTTRKPITGFGYNQYLQKRNIDLSKIQEETVLFDGDVDTAVKLFPQNINVAATLAMASGAKSKMRIRILTSPHYTTNSHEIEVMGDFGRMVTRTENVVCPDNPKTSYLAVLSGIQTLKQFCQSLKIGT